MTDQACLGYPEISCKREQSQACLAIPSAADIQRKLIVTEEDKVKPHLKTRERSDRVEDLSFGPTDRREVRWGIKEQIQSSPGGATQAHKLRNPYGLSM